MCKTIFFFKGGKHGGIMILTEYLLSAGQGRHLGCRTMLHNSRWASPRLWGMILVPRPAAWVQDTIPSVAGDAGESGSCRQRVNCLQGDKDRPLPVPLPILFFLLLWLQFQKYLMKKESSTGAHVTYACVYEQDQKAKAKMRRGFQKMCGTPKRATLLHEKQKEQEGMGTLLSAMVRCWW